MDKAVARIQQAIDHNEKIMIYGDYDADGVSSTSVMLSALQQLGADTDFIFLIALQKVMGRIRQHLIK